MVEAHQRLLELQVRIGIHTGETMFRGDEVFGDGVNIAARIRPLAEPGGVCISDEVHTRYADDRTCNSDPWGSRSSRTSIIPWRSTPSLVLRQRPALSLRLWRCREAARFPALPGRPPHWS